MADLRLTGGTGPHSAQRLAAGGAPLDRASHVLILLHGRGGAPEDMLSLGTHLAVPDVAILAPQAAGNSWWPASFLAPLEMNEPGISSGLSVVADLLDALSADGMGSERIVLGGFSQGACLAVEAAARLARPFHGVAALSGALLGSGEGDAAPRPELYGHSDKTFDYAGRLDGVRLLMGCHESDPHIPLARVRHSAEVLSGLGAAVETQIFPGEGHGIVAEEAAWLRARLNNAAAPSS